MAYSKKEDFTKTLNSDQLIVFNKLVDFCSGTDQLLCIKGFAGTGKSYIITKFISYLKKSKSGWGIRVCLTAPTNKAVGVLQKSTPSVIKKSIEFSTIHKLLGVQSSITDDGEEIFESKGEKGTVLYDIIVIDEVSMLDDQLFFDLLKSTSTSEPITKPLWQKYKPARKTNMTKIIFMGDPKQIPPINKVDCEPFLNPELYNIETVTLSQIMRQRDGNKIIEASYYIRENINEKYLNFSQFEQLGQFEIFNLNREDNREKLAIDFQNVFSSDKFRIDPASTKVIAWRNDKVRKYNDFIRLKYHGYENGAEMPQIIKGELLINNKPILENEDIIMTNNTEMKVLGFYEELKECTDLDGTPVSYYVVNVEHFDFDQEKNIETEIRILKKGEEGKLRRILKTISDLALYGEPSQKKYHWIKFYQARDYFADISYGYAITAHKAQGSTYENVYVDVADILKNEKIVERNRILYTAVTRASLKTSIIINK